MIEIYISSSVLTSSLAITQKLATNNLECQVYENYSSVCNKKIEPGYYIKIFDVLPKDFKRKVWNKIAKDLQLKCAYVITEEYKGCILNWPTIFTKSNCKVSRKRKR
tara:strand:- start:98 stop:418 length:321 start_codon:yes stop_codon:yes gene_type:complete